MAIYAASALVIGVAVGSCNLPRFSRLEARGAEARGVVTATTCGNHATFAYEFTVGARTYTGRGGGGYGNPPCAGLKVGDPVVVRYLIADPADSVPGDIDARLRNEWQSVALGALLLPLVGVLAVWRRWTRPARARS